MSDTVLGEVAKQTEHSDILYKSSTLINVWCSFGIMQHVEVMLAV